MYILLIFFRLHFVSSSNCCSYYCNIFNLVEKGLISMSVKCKSSLLNYSFLTDLLSSDINKVYLLITIIDNEKETTVSHPVVHRYLFIYIFYSVSAWFCFYSIIFFDSVWFRNVLLLVEIFKRSEIELNRKKTRLPSHTNGNSKSKKPLF